MKLLMHTCCAPCSIYCIQSLKEEGIEPDSYWFNPNIHPYIEYKTRRDTLVEYSKTIGLNLIIEENYGLDEFCKNVIDNLNERCKNYCYRVRLEKTAKYAKENGYDAFTTTLLVSPYQNHEAIIEIATEMAQKYNIKFLYRDFRIGFRTGQKEARELGLYMQKYCGCIFSEEDRYSKQISKDKMHITQFERKVNNMIKVYVASAFCKDGDGGNKAGVVLYENTLTTDNKKNIAKQLGYAETAFVTESNCADFKIEYFTPAEEVPLCGHATIATFGILKYLNKLDKINYTIETKSGILNVNLDDEQIFMQQNIPTFYEEIDYEEIKDSFDIECIDTTKPIRIVSTGLKDILIPIKNETLLNELKPNFQYIKNISKKYDVIGMHLYTFDENRIICRNFAPLYDVDEESATGTSNCALAGLLFMKMNLKNSIYTFEQGYILNSPSSIVVKIDSHDNKNIDKIYVGGNSRFTKIVEVSL